MDILKNKNKILAIILIVLVVIICIAGITLFNQNSLTQTNDTWTHEAGQKLELDAADFFNVNKSKADQITFDISKVDVDTVGEYVATATFKGKTFDIKVNVVDTTAPMVEFASRVIFTNDLENTDFTNVYEAVYEASEYTSKLIRFEYSENLQVMDETAVNDLENTIPVPCDEEELKAIGTEEIPTESGVYRSVLEIADEHGNVVLEEVYVVYDTTGALIEDTPDKIVYVETEEELSSEPTVDKNDYVITDNVDGTISAEKIITELELRDADKHEWLVHVSYTDRAGNESKADFLITVKKASASSSNAGSSNSGSSSSGGSTNSQASSSNGSQTYDPADTNKDGVVTSEEADSNISASEQAVIDAGYGVVVLLPTGNYGILTHGDGYVNGRHGSDILREYLSAQGLYPSAGIGGCWIDIDNDWYWFVARDVVPMDTSGNDWNGDGTIEFID